MKIHTAKKPHRCDMCGRLIPIGARYWRDYQEGGDCGALKDDRQHTNCLDFEAEPVLPEGYNQNRRAT